MFTDDPQYFIDNGLKLGPNPAPSKRKRAVVIGEDGVLMETVKVSFFLDTLALDLGFREN